MVSYPAQVAGAEADCRAAMSAGMAAEHDRRTGYAADILPQGSAYGDQMAVSSPPLDPGLPGGETEPSGAYFTPPRSY